MLYFEASTYKRVKGDGRVCNQSPYLDASVCQMLKQRFPHQQTARGKKNPTYRRKLRYFDVYVHLETETYMSASQTRNR